MITNYLVNNETKEASVTYDGASYTVAPNYQDGELSAVEEANCEDIVLGMIEGAAVLVSNALAESLYDSLAYSRTRKAKYDLLNQDEMRYDDLVNTTTTWQDAIAAIKAAHPKP